MIVHIYRLSNDIDNTILFVYKNSTENNDLLKYNNYIEVMIYKTLKYYLDYKNCLTKVFIKTVLINSNGDIYTGSDNIFINPYTYFSLL